MKNKEYMAVLFDLLHEDNVVSAFFIFEEAVRSLHKGRNMNQQRVAICIAGILKHVAIIERTIYGSYDIHRLYRFRTVAEYIDEISKVSLTKQQNINEELNELKESVSCFDESVWGHGDIDADGNVIDAWVESAPEEAFHPVSEWLFV